MKKVTQKDIADALSLSITAVSKALKDSRDISVETKRQVLQKAHEIGYRSMDKTYSQSKENILLFLPFDRPYKPLGETSVYFFMSALFSQFKELDYQLIALPNDKADNIEYIQKMNLLYRPSAIVLTDTIPRDPRALYCLEKNITLVTQGQTDIYSQYFSIDFNEAQWIIDTCELFFSLKAKDPLLILPKIPIISIEHRYNAFMLQMKKHNFQFSENRNIFFWEDSTILSELENFMEKRGVLPDMVLLDSEYMVMQYHKFLQKHPDTPPPLLASSTNVIDLALTLNIKCHYCYQDFWQIGIKTAQTLLYALTTDKKDWQPQHHIESLIYFNPYK
ncbi:MAG: hypothetical protein ACK5MJ_05255 [Alphaproteobacteria bacterium]